MFITILIYHHHLAELLFIGNNAQSLTCRRRRFMVDAVDNARKQRKYIPHLEMQLPFQVAVQQAQPLSSTLSQLFVFVRDKQLKRGDDNSTRGVFLSSLYSFSIHATNLTEL